VIRLARLKGCNIIFLDRDGTVNVKPPDAQYVTSPAQLFLIPGAAAAIARLNAAAVSVILVTNQRWLSSPTGDLSSYLRVHARLEELLAAQCAHLDAAYYCPHACGSCQCRKPGPGMLQRAAMEHRFNLDAAVMIGDQETDVAAGRAAGTATILLRNRSQVASHNADFVFESLADAARLVLGATLSPLRDARTAGRLRHRCPMSWVTGEPHWPTETPDAGVAAEAIGA
jgi:D-glycero-D-manno-heptose 1,7-bisphosphate phosphatase